jgi:hypothetical protein
VTPPPRGGNGGWSSERTTLPNGTGYVSNVDGHGGDAINGVVIHLPTDATTSWDLAEALDRYKGDHPSLAPPGWIDQDDPEHTVMGIMAAYYAKYIKWNSTDEVKYGREVLYLHGINGDLAQDNMFAFAPVEELNVNEGGVSVAVPEGVMGAEPEPEMPAGVSVDGPAVNANAGVGLSNDLRSAQAANPLLESLSQIGQLPSNYVNKTTAEAHGWEPGKALWPKMPGKQIGGDVFRNDDNVVPNASGRTWYEADVGLVGDMKRKNQPERGCCIPTMA